MKKNALGFVMSVSIPDLVGLGVRESKDGEWLEEYRKFQSPIWWGWGLEIEPRRTTRSASAVSIPDLVGLGVRGDVLTRTPGDRLSFQSPIWWGWGLETRRPPPSLGSSAHVSIPDLVGLGVRGIK